MRDPHLITVAAAAEYDSIKKSRQLRMKVTSKEFENLVVQAVSNISPRFQRHLRNVAFVVETESADPDLLGLYEGMPLTERHVGEGFRLPDRITIFQRPHERMAPTARHLRKLVEDTVWHEVAHYFGMDEAAVERAERRRARRGV